MASKKGKRHALICKLIRTNEVPNQKTLRELLSMNNCEATQATLSRDMRELSITKRRKSRNSTAFYVLADDVPQQSFTTGSARSIASTRGFKSIVFSGPFVVLKTKVGYAHSISADIDAMEDPAIVATIAGSNTVLVVPAEEVTREGMLEALGQIIPELL